MSGYTVTLALRGTVNCTVFWGDGTSDSYNAPGAVSHTYPDNGFYGVRITGTLTGLGDPLVPATNLKTVVDFGNVGVEDLSYAFNGASELTAVPTAIPPTVTNMQGTFQGATNFNTDISAWDTSAVTDMSDMFKGATAFAADLSTWNTSAVTNMSGMFEGATTFAADLSTWDTSAVTNMSGMFEGATSFSADISGWSTASVTDMSYMFDGTVNFTQDITGWNTSNVTTMKAMFRNCPDFNQNISAWDTSKVTDMSEMFSGAILFNQPIGNWNTSSMTNMSSMFNNATAFNQYIGLWDTSSVTNMSSMFQAANAFNANIDGWDTSNVTTMSNMFYNAVNFNQPIGSWDTTSVTDISGMFGNAQVFNQPIGSWNTGNVTEMSSIFFNAAAFNQNINSWNTSKITAMQFVFNGAEAFNQPLNNWDTSKVTDFAGMFFSAATFNQPLNSWDTSLVTNMSNMFRQAVDFNQPIGNWNVSNVTIMNTMFGSGTGPMSFNQDLSNWSVGNVTDMSYMFYSSYFNNGGNSGISNWDTSSVTDMGNMFALNYGFNQPIGSWNTSSVTNMNSMFRDASAFNQPIGAWDTSLVTNMSGMFWGSVFNQDISSWNIGAVTDTNNMFNSATMFNQPLAAWNTSAITNMNSMFRDASAFNQNISGWSTIGLVSCPPTSFATGSAIVNQPNKLPTFVCAVPTANFTGSPVQGSTPLQVSFIDTSTNTPTSWLWDFKNDGTATSTSQNPNYTYTTPGNYTVKLTATNARGSNTLTRTNYITAYNLLPVANFTATPLIGTRPLQVSFTDTTLNNPTSWLWDFKNDGTATSTSQNPTYTYTTAGTYTVKLTATNANGSNSITKTNLITVQPAPMIVSVNTGAPGALSSRVVTLTLGNTSYPTVNCLIDWGDGTSDTYVTRTNATHTYPSTPGTYTITIRGTVNHINFGTISSTTRGKYLTSVSSWGDLPLISLNQCFAYTNISSVPSTLPTTVVDLSNIFQGANLFNQNISSWNTSAVTNMSNMFNSARIFNQSIGSWNTGSVTKMASMFANAAEFNQNIGSWNIGAVTDISGMFTGASAFNNGGSNTINSWNTSAVTKMGSMFQQAIAFNQPIGSWNTSSVTSMFAMFNNATVFNQPINSWSTAAVQYMDNMFAGAAAFNQSISSWGTQGLVTCPPPAFATGSPIATQPTKLPTFICAAPVANFSGTPTSGNRPLQVSFSDTSTNTPTSWAWDFTNDGTTDSTVQNPTHTYNSAGTFSVKLTVTNSRGSDTVTRTNYISASTPVSPPVANFTGSPASGAAPLQVSFTDTSTNNPTSWLWDFKNDGSATSTLQNPTYEYSTPGTYTVKLTATNAGGSNTVTKSNYISAQAVNNNLVLVYTVTNGSGITLPLYGTVNCTVDWGDGTSNVYTSAGNRQHVYTTGGTKTVSISGTVTDFNGLSASQGKLTSVTNFGNIGLTHISFAYATNLTSVPSSIPTTVTNVSNMFYGCTNFNSSAVTTWNTDNITNMDGMFYNASSFNQPIGSWNTSAVTDMSNMFFGAGTFNQNINSWNTSSVTSMFSMFFNATSFNQPLNSWNTSSVIIMSTMFGANIGGTMAFNQNIGSWNTSNVTSMSYMFYWSSSFNNGGSSSINDWNTSSVTSMSNMFYRASSFNQPIGSWNTGNVTDMAGMFGEAFAFNQNIGSWDTHQVTNMNRMFLGADVFNTDISGWDTSAVTNTGYMFQSTTAFNQPIGSWNVSAVTDMINMFYYAASFDQDLTGWCVENISIEPSNFAQNSALSLSNYPVWGTCPGPMTLTAEVLGAFFEPRSDYQVFFDIIVSDGQAFFDWGDGSSNFYDAGYSNATHTYSSTGTYTISITGNISNLYCVNGAGVYTNSIPITSINSWGSLAPTKLYVQELDRLVSVPPNIPSSVTDLSGMFEGCTSINDPNIKAWNVSNVITMSDMFKNATAFNQDLKNWCVPNIPGEPYMWANNSGLDPANYPYWGQCGPLPLTMTVDATNGGTVGLSLGVNNYTGGPVTIDWGDGTIENYTSGFVNPNHSYWQQPGIYTISISGPVTDFIVYAYSGVPPVTSIDSWGQLPLQDISFNGCAMLTSVPNYIPSTVTNLPSTFAGCTSFNDANVISWDMTNILGTQRMFNGATTFNQNISQWTFTTIYDMLEMFKDATAFNQDLSGWCVTNITSLPLDFATNSGLDPANYPDWGTCP